MSRLVSIIVPVYNSEKYISECIKSLLDQTYNQTEIVIVDDGSTDDSILICEKYAKNNNNIKLLKEKNSGAGAARMTGVDFASGEIVMFVDSDDIISKKAVSRIVRAFDESGADIVRFHGKYYPDGKVLEKIKVKDDFLRLPYEKIVKLLTSTDRLSSMCFQAYKKECFKNIHFSGSMTYCEDYVTNQKIYAKKRDLAVIKDVLYMYRKNDQSTTKTKDVARLRKNIDERIISCNEVMKFSNKNLADRKFAKTIIGAQVERIRPDLLKYFLTFKDQKELETSIKEIYHSRNFAKLIDSISPDDVKEYLHELSPLRRLKSGNAVKAIYDRDVKKTLKSLKRYAIFATMKERVRKWM